MAFPSRRPRIPGLLLLVLAFLMPRALCAQDAPHIPGRELCAATAESSPFAIDYYYDLPIGAVAASLTISGLILEHRVDGWDGEHYKKRDINEFDRLWYNEYRTAVDDMGTITATANVLALPIGIYAMETVLGNLPPMELTTLGVMLAESYLTGYGIRNIIKSTVRRPRPYMYTGKWEEKHLEDGDFTLSFPSGHTTDAFMGATFLSYTFWKYYPESKFRIPVIAASYTLAATTGFLRVASGNHFMTDVLAGAALGTAVGFLVPFVHEKIAKVKYKGQNVLAFDGQTLTAKISF